MVLEGLGGLSISDSLCWFIFDDEKCVVFAVGLLKRYPKRFVYMCGWSGIDDE